MSAEIAHEDSAAGCAEPVTPAGVAERRRPLRDVVFLWGARVVSSFATIAVLAAAARSLPVGTFAEFALLVGLVAWLPVLDFGFGSVMQNRVAEARAHGRSDAGVIADCLGQASLFAVIAGLAAVIALGAWSAWSHAGGLKQQPGVLAFTVACLMTSGVSMTVHKIYAATNRLMVSALVSTVQNLLSLAGLWMALRAQGGEPTLAWALAGYFVPYTIVPLVALLKVVRQAGAPVRLTKDWRRQRVLKDALQFWFVLLLSLTVIQFDQFIAFNYLPATEFAHYTVATKLINFVYFPYSALLTANWSRVSVAHALRDRAQVLGIVRSSFLIGIGYLAVALPLLLALAGRFSYLLPHGAGQIEIGLLLGVGLVALNKVWTESYALVYLATGHTAIIAAYLPVQAIVAVGSQFVLVRFMGVYGLMLGGALSYFATSHWILFARTRDVLGKYTSPTSLQAS